MSFYVIVIICSVGSYVSMVLDLWGGEMPNKFNMGRAFMWGITWELDQMAIVCNFSLFFLILILGDCILLCVWDQGEGGFPSTQRMTTESVE
jgi:hypothetical protein